MTKTTKAEDNAAHKGEGVAIDTNGGLVQVAVTLTGISPMLQNAMPASTLAALWSGPGGGKKSKAAGRPLPRDWANDHFHKDADGSPVVLGKDLYACLVNAGQFIRLDGKRQVSTAQKTVLPGMLTLVESILPLLVPGTKDAAPWEVDMQQGRNPNGGEAVCIIRPRFDAWQVHCTLEVDTTQMPLALAMQLIDVAGKRVGLYDFRPARKGTYGRFGITLWQPVEAREAA